MNAQQLSAVKTIFDQEKKATQPTFNISGVKRNDPVDLLTEMLTRLKCGDESESLNEQF